ncbi:MAG: AAA family ATPase [Chloroflexota bacterium]|nr:MAG: hypothetical protein DLM70_06310 [Chloroflexota bacterium]
MRITSLELENVKSYVRQRVEFTEGLNAVCGLNGSGKTTVLEAIGFALFDFLPYSQAAFVREGEKSATIRIRLLAHDEREYEVVRRIGAGPAYFVADAESGMRLVERGPNVLEWMRAHALGMEGGADLTCVFKNAVGVPQGLMTADFLQTGITARKGIFDPLLRVEEYRNAYEYLRDTTSYLGNLAGTVREEMAHLEGETDCLPRLRSETADVQRQIQDSEFRLGRLAVEMAEVEARKAELDVLETRHREQDQQVATARCDVNRYLDLLRDRREAVERAQRAREIVRQVERGYRLVIGARGRLRELESERSERDALQARIAAVNATAKEVQGRLEGLRQQLEAARHAAQEADSLAESCRLQGETERELNDVARELHARGMLEMQMTKANGEFASLESLLAGTHERLRAAESAKGDAARFDEVQKSLQAVVGSVAQLEPSRRRLAEIRTEGASLRKQSDDLDTGDRKRTALGRRIEGLQGQASGVDELMAREQELRQELTGIRATIEYQELARGELTRLRCPLLDLTCPVVEADNAVLDGYDTRVASMLARTTHVEAELSEVTRRLDRAKGAALEVQTLSVERAQLASIDQERARVTSELVRCRRQYLDLEALIQGERGLMDERDRLRGEIVRLQEQARLAAIIPELTHQQTHLRTQLEDVRENQRTFEKLSLEMEAMDEQRERLQQTLAALGDPKTRQQLLRGIAGRETDLKHDLETEQSLLNEQSQHMQSIGRDLRRFEDLDSSLTKQRELEVLHAADHDSYLQHRDEADRLREREVAAVDVEGLALSAQASLTAQERELAETSALYDRERHDGLREQHGSLDRERASLTAERKLKMGDLDRRRVEIDRREHQRRKLVTKRDELNEIGRVAGALAFVRDTLRAAGPAITETLLANISQTANDIFAEIMDDHAAELRWTRDYEVFVQRGAEERAFAQLSGGEQMAAALSVRLALLKEMSEIDFAFFDEPTQNMDGERRGNLAEQIRAIRGFEQLIVISHDDTFEQQTDNLVRLVKVDEETRLDTA